jgi:hypothetical protein
MVVFKYFSRTWNGEPSQYVELLHVQMGKELNLTNLWDNNGKIAAAVRALLKRQIDANSGPH